MSRMHDDLDVACRALTRIAAPGHALRSYGMLAKRERVTDDMLSRALARCGDLAGGDLAEVRDNRLCPTPLGLQFRDLAQRMLALAGAQAEPVETVRVGVPPGMDEAILAPAVARFVREWGGLVSLQLAPVCDGAREAVDSGAFSLAVVAGGGSDPDERIEPQVPITVLIAAGHRLAGAAAVDADHFSPGDVVFLPPAAAVPAAGLLGRVPHARRIVVGCLATLRRLVGEGRGVGLILGYPDGPDGPVGGGLELARAAGVEPVRLGFLLSRRRNLTEPEAFLKPATGESIKNAALPPIPPVNDAETLSALPLLPESMTA